MGIVRPASTAPADSLVALARGRTVRPVRATHSALGLSLAALVASSLRRMECLEL
jgi:hypothetical protein